MKNLFVTILSLLLITTGITAFSQISGPNLQVTLPYRGSTTTSPIVPASNAITGPQDFMGYDFNALFTFSYYIPNDYTVPASGNHDLFIVFNNTAYLEYLLDGSNNLMDLSFDPRVTVDLLPGNTIRVRLNNNAVFQEFTSFDVSFRVHIKQPGSSITALQYSVSSNLGGNSSNQFSSSFNIDNTPLPITIGVFKATKINESKGHLEWNTYKEENAEGFIVERSADGKGWAPIAFVPTQAPNGNSSVELKYGLYDESPLDGKNLYRLKMLDLDGYYEYSAIRELEFSRPLEISVYPNPAQDYVTVTSQRPISIYIYDLNGKMVYHQPLSSELITKIPTANFTNSNYKVVVITDTGEQKQFSLSVIN